MRLLLCFALLYYTCFTNAQNLVLNPSFELGAVCDGATERIDMVPDWWPVRGRPSFVNTQCPLSKDSKSFIIGMKLPTASYGKVYSVQKFDRITECQQGRLSVPLEAGKQYRVSMYVRLPIQFCQLPISEIGIAFTTAPVSAFLERGVLAVPSLALQNNTQTNLTNQYDWEEVFALYTAVGGEQYLAIGNFEDTHVGMFEERSEQECTYYFMDGISVRLFDAVELPIYKKDNVRKNTRLRLSTTNFEEKSAALTAPLLQDLLALSEQLKAAPQLKAELVVYTDNSLPSAESLNLAEARANTIQQYLQEQQVSANQLTVVGKGSRQPVALSSDPNAAAKNNRVEVVFRIL